MKKIFASFLLFSICIDCLAQLTINEIMQSNVDCVMDDNNEFPDSWVELYNVGSTEENLNDYRIGLTDNLNEAWQLPDTIVNVGGWILIYCDNSKGNQTSLHTDFRLESGKAGSLYLFKKGEILEKLENLKKQPAPNIAYGRLTESSNEWGYQYIPSPNRQNCGLLCKEILGDPIFSIPGRVFESSQTINLELSLPNDAPEGSEIYFTLDGSEPTLLSKKYDGAITINSNTVVRAKILCNGFLSPRSLTHSYLFHGREVTLPVISIVSYKEYFYNDMIGILVDGTYNTEKQNYKYDWRRPINFEYFEGKDEGSELNQLCETRVAGNSTRKRPLKSLVVYANKRFGTKRLKYEFFPDQRPSVTDFKSIMLRNSGDDFYYLYMRDAIVQRSMAPYVGLDWQAWSPAVIYINGEYKGILNIRERSNEDNVYTHYDGLEDIDMIENGSQLKEGDMNNYLKFKEFYHEEGHNKNEYEKWMDVSEYRDLIIMNLFYNNVDFPGNNVMMWRPRTEDGRWRYIAKDTDYTLGRNELSPDYNIIEWLYNPDYDSRYNWGNNGYESTLLFRQLMKDDMFFNEFIDRNAIYMGDFLREEVVGKLWDQMYNRIRYEYPYHRLLFEYQKGYEEELAFARGWLSKRHAYHYQHLADFYQLGEPYPLIVNQTTASEEIEISINGVKLQTGQFNGYFFADREIKLEAKSKDGSSIYGWSVLTENESGSREILSIGDTYSFKMPKCKRIIINPLLSETTGIYEKKTSPTWSYIIDNNTIELKGVDRGEQVLLYNMNGTLIYKSLGDKKISLNHKGVYILRVGEKTQKVFVN